VWASPQADIREDHSGEATENRMKRFHVHVSIGQALESLTI
jgi:hypothetical protein